MNKQTNPELNNKKLREELEVIFYKLDAEGTDYAVMNGYANSEIVEQTYPKYKKALTRIQAALKNFEKITEEIREEWEIPYS